MKIAVIDFGSSYTAKICEKLEELSVQGQLFDNDVRLADLSEYDGIIFSGSPDAVYNGGRLVDKDIIGCGKPLLGICYGHQLIHYLEGGKVQKAQVSEHKKVLIHTSPSLLFKGLPESHGVRMAHDDEVVELAPGYERIAYSKDCYYAASQNIDKKVYTVQFHPEHEENDYGIQIIKNFLDIVADNENI